MGYFDRSAPIEAIGNLKIPYCEEYSVEKDNDGYFHDRPFYEVFYSLHFDIIELHKIYCMNVLTLKDWIDFIEEYKEEMEDLKDSIQGCYYERKDEEGEKICSKKVLAIHPGEDNRKVLDRLSRFCPHCSYEDRRILFQRKRVELMNLFLIEHGFSDIEKLVRWKEYGEYKILREIRNFLISWESFSKKEVPYDFFNYKIEHWEFFFKNNYHYFYRNMSLESLMKKVEYNIPIERDRVKLEGLSNYMYFEFFSWKEIQIRDIENNEKSLDISMVRNFFHKDSHFEDDIFWMENRIPFYIFYDGEKASQEMYEIHRENFNRKKGILNTPYHLFPKNIKHYLYDFCLKKINRRGLWDFLHGNLKIKGKDIFKKIFHILGRLHKDYHFYQYHYFLKKLFKKEIVKINKCHSFPDSFLFPEFDIQEEKVKGIIRERWKECYSFFEDEILSFLCQERWEKSMYMDLIPFFTIKDFDMSNEFIYSMVNKRRTYSNYLNFDKLLSIRREKKETYSRDGLISKIDNYILEKKNKSH